MQNFGKLSVALVVGLSLLWTSFWPVNAASNPLVHPVGRSIFPELETCADCHIEANKRVGLTGTVLTVQDTVLYLMPIQDDFSFDSMADSLRVPILPGMSFEIAQTHKLVDSQGNASSYGLLANTYGGRFLGILLLASNSVMNRVDYVRKNLRLSPVVTYIAGANDVYPNKVENILLALEHLSAYQDLRQGFRAEKYISTLRAFGFYSYQAFQEYKDGALASGISAPAGGVCAPATGLASLAYLTEGAKIVDIVHHDQEHLYFQGPFSAPAEAVDSGISIRPDGSFEELGFTLPDSGYFRVDIQLLPSGVAYKKTDLGMQLPSDFIMLVSLSYDDLPMEEQTSKIRAWISRFVSYRTTENQEVKLGDMIQAVGHIARENLIFFDNLKLLNPLFY